MIPSLENIGLLSVPGTDLKGFFDLNVRRARAAENYLKLYRENEIDVILMPPAAHTAVALDHWTKAAYTSLWNYLDYPAIVIPTDHVRDTDFADELSNAQFGSEDEKLYKLCTCSFLPDLSFVAQAHLRCHRYGPGTVQRCTGWCHGGGI